MAIKKLCAKAGCARFREEGSKYCSLHKDACEKADRERREQYLKEHPIKYNSEASPYARFYKTYRWHKESAEFIQSRGCCCEICGRSDLRLQVHHNWPNFYDYTDEFWDKSHWIVVCANCHAKLTRGKDLEIVANHTAKFRFDFRKDK